MSVMFLKCMFHEIFIIGDMRRPLSAMIALNEALRFSESPFSCL